MARPYRIYTSDPNIRDLKGVLRAMYVGVRDSRYAGYRIFVKDVRAEYSGGMFGLFWDFADPLVLGLIFYFLKQADMISSGDIDIPYSVFIIYGLLIYQTFIESVLLSLDVIKRSSNMLTHLKIAPEALILSVVYRICFGSIFRIIVMLGFSLWASWTSTLTFSPIGFLKFLLLFPAIILAGMAVGTFLAPFGTIYNDIGRAVRIALTLGRYASPVLYAIPAVAPFTYIYAFNPIALVIDNLRSLATENVFIDAPGFFLRIASFIVLFLVSAFVFHVSASVVAERA